MPDGPSWGSNKKLPSLAGTRVISRGTTPLFWINPELLMPTVNRRWDAPITPGGRSRLVGISPFNGQLKGELQWVLPAIRSQSPANRPCQDITTYFSPSQPFTYWLTLIIFRKVSLSSEWDKRQPSRLSCVPAIHAPLSHYSLLFFSLDISASFSYNEVL